MKASDSQLSFFDFTFDHKEIPEFFEFQVSCGGDACTYRIYKKCGTIREK